MAVPAVTLSTNPKHPHIVLAAGLYKNNADLIEAVHRIGYLTDKQLVLDMTFGRGTFWKRYRPARLITNSLGSQATSLRSDMTRTPFPARCFDVVVCDPPYKLNGTPDKDVDERYGVDVVRTRDDRHALMYAAMTEACRLVVPGGLILYKCQQQVNSGRVWWQPRMMAEHAERYGCRHRDSFLLIGSRAQPGDDDPDKEQDHARQNYSTLLVIERPHPPRRRRRTEQESLL